MLCFASWVTQALPLPLLSHLFYSSASGVHTRVSLTSHLFCQLSPPTPTFPGQAGQFRLGIQGPIRMVSMVITHKKERLVHVSGPDSQANLRSTSLNLAPQRPPEEIHRPLHLS